MSTNELPQDEFARRMTAYKLGVESGMTISDIARLLNLQRQTFKDWVCRHVDGISERSPPKPGPHIKATRPCISCRREMHSTGPHHRMCDPCRNHAYLSSPLEPHGGGHRGRRVVTRAPA